MEHLKSFHIMHFFAFFKTNYLNTNQSISFV